jgi:hypothetical protein
VSSDITSFLHGLLFVFFDLPSFPDICGDRMKRHTRGGGYADRRPNLVGRRFDPESRECRQVLIEGTVIPESFFTATNTAMPGLNRIARASIPSCY